MAGFLNPNSSKTTQSSNVGRGFLSSTYTQNKLTSEIGTEPVIKQTTTITPVTQTPLVAKPTVAQTKPVTTQTPLKKTYTPIEAFTGLAKAGLQEYIDAWEGVTGTVKGFLGELTNPKYPTFGAENKGGFQAKTPGEKVGQFGADLLADTVGFVMSGGGGPLNTGSRALNAVVSSSPTMAKAQESVVKFGIKKLSSLENILSKNRLTFQEINDITAGKITDPSKLAQFAEAKKTGLLDEIITAHRKSGGNTKQSLSSFLKQTVSDITDAFKSKKPVSETKLLPTKTGELSPMEARATVVNTNLENTPVGNQIMKASIEAEKIGSNVIISPTGNVLVPRETISIDKAKYPGIKTASVVIRPDNTGSMFIEFDKESQGKGRGTALVKEAEQKLLDKGVNKVVIDSFKESVGFWEKMGYAPIAEQPKVSGGNVRMEKTLSPVKPDVKPIDALIEEAKKYDSAEEFVNDLTNYFNLRKNGLTKSQLTDIWNKANKETVTKPTPQEVSGADSIKLVEEAITSGDLEGAKVLYDDLSKQTYLPSFETIKRGLERETARSEAIVANEGVKAVKESYGQYADVVQKMKNFLRISADKKGPSGLLFQEHIPKDIFGVGSDEVADSLGISEDQFLQRILSELSTVKQQVPTPTKEVGVPREQLPVGTGKEKVSGLSKRVYDTLTEVPEELKDQLGLQTYNQMIKKENRDMASEYVLNNKSDALKVLKGEIEAPQGILRNSIFIALDELASSTGDRQLALDLTSLSSTRYGQEISILTELNKNNPVSIMRDIIKVREEVAKKRFGKSTKEATDNIKREISRKTPKIDKYDWNKFLDTIECK